MTPLIVKCDSTAYWKVRAIVSDIECLGLQIQQQQQALAQMVARRADLLRAAVGEDVDLNFVTSLSWNDETTELTLDGAIRFAEPLTT